MNPHRGRPEDITEAYYRGLMHSCGYRRTDIDKPQIAVVNSWTDINPGHEPLKELAGRVKEGIWAAIKIGNIIDKRRVRLVRMKDTNSLAQIEVSESMLAEVRQSPYMNIEGEPYELAFDEKGNLF